MSYDEEPYNPDFDPPIPDNEPHPPAPGPADEAGQGAGLLTNGLIDEGSLEEAVFSLMNHVDTLTGTVNEHGAALEAISEKLDELLADPPGKRPAPWNFKEVPGPKQRELWDEVREWVAWFNPTYTAADNEDFYIPPCWFKHPRGRMLLLSTYIAWRTVHYGVSNPITHFAQWSNSTLPDALRLAREGAGGWQRCTDNQRHTDTPRTTTQPFPEQEYTSWLEAVAHAETVMSAEPAVTTAQIPLAPRAPVLGDPTGFN